jgi:hypothetical protein
MARSGTWAGWVAFAGWLMILIGTLDFFQGLIAVIRDTYYVLTPSEILVFDMTTWGWVTLFWGIIVASTGLGLLTRAGWARWISIFIVSLNFVIQLGFLGSARYPLWTLTGLGLSVLVLYALIVRWDEATAAR